MIFWNGWIPFFFSNAIESKAASAKGNQNNNSDDDAVKVQSTLTYFRGTVNVERILREACDASNQNTWNSAEADANNKSRFVIHYVPAREDNQHRGHNANGLMWYQQGYYRLLGIAPEQLGKAPVSKGRALDNLIFPKRVKELIHEIELWRTSREWYAAKGNCRSTCPVSRSSRTSTTSSTAARTCRAKAA
jgi:hypothetical protein